MAESKIELPKNWNIEVEGKITEKWMKSELFAFDPKTKKKIYSIDTPPPYINAPIHIGHAATYVYMDFFARYRRMKGYEVLFPLGLDRNGLPIEMGAEKKFNVSPFSVGREKFISYCEQLLKETSSESISSFSKLGISFSSYKQGNDIGSIYLTDAPEYRVLTQSTFIDLFKKGLIYEDKRINNWDPKLRTTIADSEIDYVDLPSTFNDIKWKVKESGEEIVIGTTRPELICSCGMVIFHPDDKRYKHLTGKTAITPLFGIEVPIKPHPIAQIDKCTGIVMMCSAGDLSDIQFFREQKLTPIISINHDGTMNEQAGQFKGLKVKDARAKIIEVLKEKSLLVKQEKITHRTPISERSKAEVEFIEMPEFYLRQVDKKKEIKKICKNLKFYPEQARKILDDWIESVSIDWPISRRRYYATEIPLWYSEYEKGIELVAIPTQGKYYRPWKDDLHNVSNGAEIYDKKTMKKLGTLKDEKFKKLKWKGEERVLDTWFDSSISELNLLKYKTDDEFFKKAYPCTMRPQGKEIVRTWLYYTILRGYLETGKLCFEEAWIHQHILDASGRKMAKSVGNVIDPQKLMNAYGAEAFRLWSASEGDISKQDLSCSEDKIKGELKTLTKLLNVANFISQFEKPEKFDIKNLTELDKLYIDYMEDLTLFCDEAYNIYNFYNPAIRLRKFLWDDFASHYLELVKARAYNGENIYSKTESESAKYTLNYLLDRLLILYYPIIPQITTLISEVRGNDLLQKEFPKSKKGKSDLKNIEKIMEFNGLVWKKKKDEGKSLRAEISGIKIPKELKDFEKDLIQTHKLV